MKNKVEGQPEKKVKLPIAASSDFDPARTTASEIKIASLLASITQFLEAQERDRKEKKEEQKRLHQQMILNLIFGESSKQYYTPSFDNPYAEIGGITAPTKDALSSVFCNLGGASTNMRELKITGPSTIDGSLLLLGGPVPNPVSRSILGIGGGSPIFKQALHKEVRLPVSFSNIESFDPGPGKRPEYEILVNGKSLPIKKGEEDYLVITSMPNIYSSTYFFRHRLMNVAGLHGGGTRAIDLVLNDEFLGKLYKDVNNTNKLKNAAAWQAVIKVKLDNENSNFPKEIIDWATFRIDLDEDDFGRSNEHVLLNGIPFEIANS